MKLLPQMLSNTRFFFCSILLSSLAFFISSCEGMTEETTDQNYTDTSYTAPTTTPQTDSVYPTDTVNPTTVP